MKYLEEWVIGLRREFHKHPEIAFNEVQTAAKIADILRELGLEVKTGYAGTGVAGILKGGNDGPTLGLRADIDALPIQEKNDVEYKSRIDGMMHACGHDAHTAILLGVARYIIDNDLVERINGNVKFIFQPAEEGVRGAKAIIKEGILEEPHVDCVLGCHVSNEMETGEAGFFDSVSHASSDRFRAVFIDKGAHAARPHKTNDTILAACFFATQIQTIMSRNIDPIDSGVVSIGVIQGGSAANILPEKVLLEGTVRSFNENVRKTIKKRLAGFADSIKTAYDLDRVDYQYTDGCPPCVNTPEATKLLREAAAEVLQPNRLKTIQPGMGAEDFAYYSIERPSAIFKLGTSNQPAGENKEGHTPLFDIDESALFNGVKIFVSAIEKFFNE